LHEPPILFLDEPTGGVDPISRRNFWDLIYELSSRGVTVFVTTHYMDEAEHCNTVGLIYSGKLIALESPTNLKQKLEAYQIFEIQCSNPIEAMEILQKEQWVVETSIFGSAFHVSTIICENPKERILKSLESRSITVYTIESIVPSLEDVFIHLIAKEDRKQNTNKIGV
jgi:ABC-2 type transport system ATP-binding protein